MKSISASLALLAVLALSSTPGCGGNTDDGAGTGGSPSGGGSGCPNVAGRWKVSKHCESALVGTAVQVAQSGCSFTDETYGFTGMLRRDGTLTLTSGTADATCTGTVSTSQIIESCTVAGAPCEVTLTR